MKRSTIAAIGMVLLAAPALLPAQTSQDFQNPGTPYVVAQTATSIAPAPSASGGPTGGPFLRLLDATSTGGTNSIAFQRTDPGGFTTIQVDFDFRMAAPGPGKGLGMGFVLLNTAVYGKDGGVVGGVAGDAEEPNFTKSLGIGFDIHDDPGVGDPNANHVSVHYDGAVLTQVDAGAIALAGDQWIHAQIVIRPGGGHSDVSVTLTPPATPPATPIPVALITNFAVPGLQPYEGRAYFAARMTSTETAHHDLANVVLNFTAVPAVLGQWSGILPIPVVPIHSSLLPNDKIVCWDREAGWGGNRIPHLIDVNTLDLPAGTINVTMTPDPGFEFFCSGHVLTSDGKLFVAGGHLNEDGRGLDTAFLYDPTANSWTRLPDMGTGGRWYPTVTILGNGDPVVTSGQKVPGGGNINQNVQVMQFSSSGTWKTLTGAEKELPLYPYLHLAPNGKLFLSGPDGTTQYLDTAGTGSWTNVATAVKGGRDYGGSVLYDTGKVLLLGGGSMEPGGKPTSTAEVIDLGAATPAWRAVGSMAYARRQCNSLILPDGTVLVTGGTEAAGFTNDAGSILAPELWDPSTEKFTMLAGMNIARLYHSETILLPDGRVASQGSGRGGNFDENNAEIYSPPYLFKGPGPSVTAAPSKVLHGESFQVTTPDGASVVAVTLLRLTSVTHTNNMSQGIVRPTFSVGAGSITATLPVNPNLCPPGPYLLFLLNSAGVPSVGKHLLINKNLPPVAAVPGNITTPAVDASGASVTLDGTPSSDPDNAITAYEWYEGMNLIATGSNPMVSLSVGVHTITLKVTDAGSLTSTTTFTVTIADLTAPVIQSLTATPTLLRSVTNQLVSVTLNAVATDAIDPAPTTQVLSVTSTEGAGGASPDWVITPGSMTLTLRAERNAIYRRYTVTVGATDSSANTSTQSTDVKVRGKWFP